jgi:large subunit ribosomal protein L13
VKSPAPTLIERGLKDVKKKTYSAKETELERKWFVIDASGKTLGRLATRVAWLLSGKGKPLYTPHVDCGDHVIIVNASKVKVTGNKMQDKIYYHHTGYLGHLKSATLGKVMSETPERAIESAVHGMVSKSKLGRQIMSKLKVYRGAEHRHAAQNPITIE